jgi:hypothetical protein
MFLYQVINKQIRILGYRGYNGSVRVPEKIENLPVTELSAYAFSGGWGREKMLSSLEQEMRFCDEEGNPVKTDEKDMPPTISCEELKELYLPKTIKKIGNYAFYNCFELSRMECYSSIDDLGSGLFTGCAGIRFLDFHLVDGERSCLKEILSELRQELYVNYYNNTGNARLVFPEMFEESVEHTPARIIIREMHGCGHMYRYCFDQTEFQFHKYDALFPHLLVQESERVVGSLVVNRLYTPVHFLEHDKMVYETYLREHIESIAKLALKEDPAMFLWLAREYGEDQNKFDSMVEMASKEDKPELLSNLMDLRRRRFPARKRTFSL